MEIFMGTFGPLIMFVCFIAVLFAISRYKRCPTDKVIVVYGANTKTGTSKCVHSGGVFVWPLIQDYSILSLRPMKAKVELNNAFALKKNRVSLKATVTFAISTEKRYLQLAADRLLSLSPEQIEMMAGDIIEGQLRLTVAKHAPDEIIENELVFIEEAKEAINEEIGKIGLQAIHIQLKDIVAKEIEQ